MLFIFLSVSLISYSARQLAQKKKSVRIASQFQGTRGILSWQVTGKRPVAGNNVSHAKNRTRRRFLPNLHFHRFWVESENRWIRLRISAKGLRVIDKNGIDSVLKNLRMRGEKI